MELSEHYVISDTGLCEIGHKYHIVPNGNGRLVSGTGFRYDVDFKLEYIPLGGVHQYDDAELFFSHTRELRDARDDDDDDE